VLKHEGIEVVVAPYEADAQLAYLALTGNVDAVITEDSDLLPYGCPTASPGL
jgi:exonuclease 1